MSTVLWGRRRGDVIYASRDFWRRNIPIGDARLTVASPAYFDVGETFEVVSGKRSGSFFAVGGSASPIMVVTGKEGAELGVRAL